MIARLVCLLLVVAIAPATAFVPVPADDAGTGSDAPGDPRNAPSLPPGRYEGNLTPPDDTDWFRVHRADAGPACIQVTTGGPATANLTLSTNVTLDPRVDARLMPHVEQRLALATWWSRDAYFGLAPVGLRSGPPVHASAGAYAFDAAFITEEPGPGDAGSGGDAGNTTAGAVRVAPGCFGGTLDGPDGDEEDTFLFEAEAGSITTLSFVTRDSAVTLELVSPGNNRTAIPQNEAAAIELNETGDWTLLLQSAAFSESEYLIGLTLDEDDPPPEQSPCRPTCVME